MRRILLITFCSCCSFLFSHAQSGGAPGTSDPGGGTGQPVGILCPNKVVSEVETYTIQANGAPLGEVVERAKQVIAGLEAKAIADAQAHCAGGICTDASCVPGSTETTLYAFPDYDEFGVLRSVTLVVTLFTTCQCN